MKDGKVIQDNAPRIDFDNLCGGNDFAKLTDNFSREGIDKLIWEIEDHTDRIFATKAILLQKKLAKSPDDEDLYDEILLKQVTLQKEYADEKRNRPSAPISETKEKIKGYNATESAVLMYFLLDACKIYFSNGEKNCLQKNAQEFYSKVFGLAKRSYDGKIILDFTDPATRTAMEKVATDLANIAPSIKDEIWHQYGEYEDDFYKKHPEKRKKILA